MIDALVFDFDGIIVDSEPAHYRAFAEILALQGIEMTYDDYLRSFIGYDDRDALRVAFATAGQPLNETALPDLCKAKAEAFDAIVRKGLDTYPGVVALIESAAREVPVAIASGAIRADIDLMLQGVAGGRVTSCFSAIVTADNVSRSKPDPETYAVAALHIGVHPQHCLAIEDTSTGVTSATDAGLRTLAVTNTCGPDLLTNAERVIETLKGVDLAVLRQWYA